MSKLEEIYGRTEVTKSARLVRAFLCPRFAGLKTVVEVSSRLKTVVCSGWLVVGGSKLLPPIENSSV
jgi:hypothetical protein